MSNRIKKARVNFKKAPKDRISQEYIEGRLELVEQLWDEFVKGHKEIMRSSDVQQLENSSYITEDIYDQTEELYIEYKCELKVKAKAFTVTENTNAGNVYTQSRVSQVKLPKINIPMFSGKYSEWSTFRDLFQSLRATCTKMLNLD